MNDALTSESAPVAAFEPPRSMKLATAVLGFLLAWIVLEIVLRLVPHVISPHLLVLFEPGLRAEIGSGTYPLEKDYRPIERDDAGPPLLLANPGTKIFSIDQAPGGAERFADELGFCNPPGRYSSRDTIDVIAIGDSFTWCHALDARAAWPAELGDLVHRSTYSLGQGGKGPYEYLQFLRAFGLAKQPRVVIMNIYGGNDLRDAIEYDRYRSAVARGAEPPSEEPRPVAPALAASVVGRHSYALNLVLALAGWASSRGAHGWEKSGIDFHYELELGERRVPFNVENRDRDEVLAARQLAAGTASLTLWDAALSRFANMGREHGFVPVVAYTPSAHVAYEGHVRFADPSLVPVLESLDRAQRGFLAQRAAEDGFEFFDLTPALQEAAGSPGGALLYNAAHMHLSERGHEVLAAAFARFLETRGFVKSERANDDG